MGIACGPLYRFCRSDIHEVGRRKLKRIFTVGNLVIVKSEFLAGLLPGVIGQHRNCSVIPVIINGPLIEDSIWIFGVEEFLICLIMRVIYNCMAIGLACIGSARFQYLACF